MISTDGLLDHWRGLLSGHDELGAELISRYDEPHRAYHTLDHLAHLLGMIDELATGAEDLRTVGLAAWFHDAVYEIGAEAAHNENASAELAETRLGAAGLNRPAVDEVVRLVRLTATHDPDPADAAGALLSDADMSILAAEPPAYRRYAEQVRAEYAHLGDATFTAGRSAFVAATLRTPIFTTTAGLRLQPQAQRNLTAELARLTAGVPTAQGPG